MRKTLELNENSRAKDWDWEGNNLAVTCPLCEKVYIVSGAPQIHGGTRSCPSCGKSEATIDGGRKSGGKAAISWAE
jgi:ribosomal protein S27E